MRRQLACGILWVSRISTQTHPTTCSYFPCDIHTHVTKSQRSNSKTRMRQDESLHMSISELEFKSPMKRVSSTDISSDGHVLQAIKLQPLTLSEAGYVEAWRWRTSDRQLCLLQAWLSLRDALYLMEARSLETNSGNIPWQVSPSDLTSSFALCPWPETISPRANLTLCLGRDSPHKAKLQKADCEQFGSVHLHNLTYFFGHMSGVICSPESLEQWVI